MEAIEQFEIFEDTIISNKFCPFLQE